VVEAAEVVAVVVATTEVEVEEATTLLADVLEEADARTEEQAACAALKTARASVAPQAEMTQVVEAVWIAASLDAEH